MKGIEQFLQVDAATLGALKYAGTWNASTNTPTLASGVGVQGQYYVVSVAGSTNLDGETNWQVGDWAVFNGSVWQKVDGGSTGLLTTLTVTGNTYLATTSGDVGVGTSSPDAKLRVNGTAKVGEGVASNTSKLMVNTVSGVAAGIQLFQDANESWIIQNPASTTALTFGNSGTERMRIDSSGDVGIGTTSPGVKLDVQGVVPFIRLKENTTGYLGFRGQNDSGNFYFGIDNSSGSFYGSAYARVLYADGAYPMVFYTNATERARIDSSGNVGIGTSSPSSAYSGATRVAMVAATGTTAASLRVSSANASAELYSAGSVTEWGLYSASNSPFSIWTNGNKNLTLDSAGNLGLGVTPSAASLPTIQSAYGLFTGNVEAHISKNAYYNSGWKYAITAPAARYSVGEGDSGYRWYQAGSGTAGDAISFTQAMTLDASGNLLVGATSQAGVNSRGYFRQSADSDWRGVSVVSAASDQFVGGLYIDSSGNFTIAQSYLGTSSYKDIVFRAGGSERMRLDSSGNLGLGVTPSASTIAQFEGGSNLILVGRGNVYASNNATFNSGWKYISTAGAAQYNISNAEHRWFTAPSGTAGNTISFTQAMTLDAAGNLGLGVTPQAWNANHRVIELAGASSAHVVAYVNGLSSGTNYYINSGDVITYSYTGQNATRYLQNTTGQHQWFTAPSGTAGNAISFTQAMTLDASGNLLVGGTSPVLSTANRGNITITGSASSIVSVGTSASAYTYLYHDASGAEVWNNQNTYLRFGTNNTERARIDSSGNLLVGTTTGSARIISAVADGTYSFGAVGTTKAIRISHSSTASKIEGVDSTLSASYQPLELNGSYLSFETSGTERARIPAAGGMVVGTAALATNATDGFLYVPTCAGTPTGTPTTQTGTAPIVIDTTNNKLYFYSGGQWRDAGP